MTQDQNLKKKKLLKYVSTKTWFVWTREGLVNKLGNAWCEILNTNKDKVQTVFIYLIAKTCKVIGTEKAKEL